MKAFLLTLLFLAGLSSAAQAQMKEHYAERFGGPATSAVAAEALTRQMTKQLQLNESQIIKLRKVNTIKVARVEEIKWQFNEDQPRMQRALSELQSQYETECGRILTPSQLSVLRSQQPDTQPASPTTEGGLG